MRRTHVSLAVVAVAATVVAVPTPAGAHPDGVPVQLVAMNDFHGRISLTAGGDSELVTAPGPDGLFGENELGESDDVVTVVGGSANVASTVQRLQTAFRLDAGGSAASLFVGAGDVISASPFESSAFKDEPSIEVLNAMGLDVSSVGNHEFDRGTRELRRISAATDGRYTDDVTACEGVTVGVDGCFGEGDHGFTGAEFPYLAANVILRDTRRPILPPYQVFHTATGVRVALIGVVTTRRRPSSRPPGSPKSSSSTRRTPSTAGWRCCRTRASRRSAYSCTRAARRPVPPRRTRTGATSSWAP